MTEKRFKMKKLEYEVYFIDSQQEYVDEDEPNFEIDGEKTLSNSQILDLLNENEQLKQRNDRQSKQLDRLYNLIEEKDWRTLSDILDDFKRCDEQLEREWKCYE